MANGEIQTLDPVQVTPSSNQGGMLDSIQGFMQQFGDSKYVQKALKRFKNEVKKELVPELMHKEYNLNQETVQNLKDKGAAIFEEGIANTLKREGGERVESLQENVLNKESAAAIAGGVTANMLSDIINDQAIIKDSNLSLKTPSAPETTQDIFYNSKVQWSPESLMGASISLAPQLVDKETGKQSYKVGFDMQFNSPGDVLNAFRGVDLPASGRYGTSYTYSPETGHNVQLKVRK